MALISFLLTDAFYLVSFVFYKKNRHRYGFFFLVWALSFHTLSIITRGTLAGYPPFFSPYEILLFFSWAVVLLSLSAGLHKINGMFIAGTAAVILGIVCFLNPGLRETLPSELKTILFPIHVSACLLGYGAFFISFICGIFYLAQNKLDYGFISYQAIILGLSFLSFGIIAGSIWAKRAWGSFWSWDPKETAALITWFIYAFCFLSRAVFPRKEKLSAWLSIAGFLSLIFTWFGVNHFFPGLHSYKNSP